MKKLNLFTALLIAITVAFTAIACTTSPTLEKISVKEGTVATQVTQGESLDTSKLVILAHYSDGTSKEVKVGDADLKIGTFSTAQVGTFYLEISYQGKTCKIAIKVNPSDPNADLEITEVYAPKFVTDYKNAIAEKTNKKEEFYDRAAGYFVGDDNEFIFKPLLLVEDDGLEIEFKDEALLDAEVTIRVKEGTTYTDVDEAEYVESNAYGSYKFKAAALNKTLEFTVKPFIKGYPEKATQKVSFEFTVIDGWNANTVADLAMIEYDRLRVESGEKNEKAVAQWNEYKIAHNLPTDLKVNAVIMHGNIKVTKNDVPATFFYNQGDADLTGDKEELERTTGSLRDNIELYIRGVLPGEHFELIGNFFTISTEEIPVVTRDGGKVTAVGEVISHATFIKFRGLNRDITDGTAHGSAIMKNMYLIGNSNRSESPEKSGGLIFQKIRDVDFAMENIVSVKWFITYFPEGTRGDVTTYSVNKCKSYDNFNSFVYVWGGGNFENDEFFTINNSEMIGAGGPVMILDHAYSDENGGWPSNVKVTNSKLESIVAGTEGWFSLVKATALVPQIKLFDSELRKHGRTFLVKRDKSTAITGDDNNFNFIAVFKSNNSGGSPGPTFDPIKGYLGIDDNVPLDFGQGSGAASQAAKQYLDYFMSQKLGAPVFQSSAGGIGYGAADLKTGKVQGLFQLPQNPIADTDPLFSGDYLNLYLSSPGESGYMGVMFGYYGLDA